MSRSISGVSIELHEFSDEFLTERYVGWLNDPEIVRFSRQRLTAHTLESCRSYADSFAGTPHCLWAIVHPELGHIGNINAYVDQENRVADIGIMIGERAAQGKGLAADAWMTAARHLFEERGMHKVTAGTMAANTAMVRLMERTGMKPDGTRREQYEFKGTRSDLVMAAFLAEDWPQTYAAWLDSLNR